jgi:hypothetical protein
MNSKEGNSYGEGASGAGDLFSSVKKKEKSNKTYPLSKNNN